MKKILNQVARQYNDMSMKNPRNLMQYGGEKFCPHELKQSLSLWELRT